MPDEPLFHCPMPHSPVERILLAHGEGARLTRRLIRAVMFDAFENTYLRPLSDAAVLPPIEGPVVVSTDSYVVSPLFFPGGDIGSLAVNGTVNDLAVSGAIPLYLTLGLIIEEGLLLTTLRRVISSMAESARACGVPIVTGDTKVVPHGAADGLFVNTTGVGRLRSEVNLGAHRVVPGDKVIISGTLGDHGMAILSAREGLEMGAIQSDTAPLGELVEALFDAEIDVHFMRDPTRGGVSSVMHELAEAADVSILIDESLLPISEPVRGACELLGLDPLFVANEGKLIVVVSPENADKTIWSLRQHPLGETAAVIGEVLAKASEPSEPVLLRNAFRVVRVLDEPSGALLPRIC